MTKADEIVERFRHLNVWKRGEERAPHKPLLVLLALGRLQASLPRLVSFEEIEPKLRSLLAEFGPPRKSLHPEQPFWWLQSDGVWEVSEDVSHLRRRKSGTNPLKSELIHHHVQAGFPAPLYSLLTQHPEIVRAIVVELLGGHFPESLHAGILAATGLDVAGSVRSAHRDPSFRSDVLAVWRHECAFCGFHVQLDSMDIGLEAAHIRWVQAGGPETVNNGLACCSIHHLALDRGAITIADNYTVLVSSRLHGAGQFHEQFLSLHAKPLSVPNRKAALPHRDYLQWHRKEVFRGLPLD